MAKEKAKEIEVGSLVVFNGYDDTTPEDEQILTKGETYEVSEIETTDEGVTIVVKAENPDFDAKKRESKSNQKYNLVDVFEEEISLYEEKAKAPAKRTRAAPEPEAEEEAEEAEEAPAKPKAASKTATKPAAKAVVKPSKKAAPAADEEVEEEDSEVPELENEDKTIVALVAEHDDLIELAQELTEDGAALDYKLGGVLYHIRRGREYRKLGEQYAERGGFELFLKDHLNIEYRKAMYLVKIYVKFNQHGIDAKKVAELGWTKCSKIAEVMTGENADALIEMAENNSVADLTESIKESYKSVGGTKGELKKMAVMKFRLFEDQGEAVTAVLKGVTEQMGFKRVDDAFEHIVMEWAMEHDFVNSKVKKQFEKRMETLKDEAEAEATAAEEKAAAEKTAKAAPAKAKAPAKTVATKTAKAAPVKAKAPAKKVARAAA